MVMIRLNLDSNELALVLKTLTTVRDRNLEALSTEEQTTLINLIDYVEEVSVG